MQTGSVIQLCAVSNVTCLHQSGVDTAASDEAKTRQANTTSVKEFNFVSRTAADKAEPGKKKPLKLKMPPPSLTLLPTRRSQASECHIKGDATISQTVFYKAKPGRRRPL